MLLDRLLIQKGYIFTKSNMNEKTPLVSDDDQTTKGVFLFSSTM